MAMPDAIKALVDLWAAPYEKLDNLVYNVTSFSLTAEEFAQRIKKSFQKAEITFEPDTRRQKIIDSWPADLNVSAAEKDWNWSPEYDQERAFEGYLFPNISKRYESTE
jgi:nucleoside-diphosphate-sugar epimerase